MPLLSCQCLNVQMSVVQQSIEELRQQCLQYPHELPDTPSHDFFSQGVFAVEFGVAGISYKLDRLSCIEDLDSRWRLHRCLCCNTDTHATNDSVRLLAASTALLWGDAVDALEQHDRFSPLFQLVLPPELPRPLQQLPLPSSLPQNMQQQYSQYLEELWQACQRRLVLHEQQQRQQTEREAERARRDCGVVMAMLEWADQAKAAGTTHEGHNLRRPSLTSPSALTRQGASSMRLPQEGSEAGELRHEDMFLYDGGAAPHDISPSPSPDTLDIDRDYLLGEDQDYIDGEDDPPGDQTGASGYFIPGGAGGNGPRGGVAQSVPITIPNFGQRGLRRARTRDASHKVSKTPAEIAASILAISKSLHGDAVGMYGELPPPRRPTPHRPS